MTCVSMHLLFTPTYFNSVCIIFIDSLNPRLIDSLDFFVSLFFLSPCHPLCVHSLDVGPSGIASRRRVAPLALSSQRSPAHAHAPTPTHHTHARSRPAALPLPLSSPLAAMSDAASSSSSGATDAGFASSFPMQLKRAIGGRFQMYLDWSVPHITARSESTTTHTHSRTTTAAPDGFSQPGQTTSMQTEVGCTASA